MNQKEKAINIVKEDRIRFLLEKAGLFWSDEYITELVTNGESVFRCCETHEDAIQRLQHLAPSISFCFDSLK